jgi:hypothetical protein
MALAFSFGAESGKDPLQHAPGLELWLAGLLVSAGARNRSGICRVVAADRVADGSGLHP